MELFLDFAAGCVLIFMILRFIGTAENKMKGASPCAALEAKRKPITRLAAGTVSISESALSRTVEDARFERIITSKLRAISDRHFYATVAGVTFANPDGTNRQQLIAQCGAGEQLRLIREPENPHDSGAVAVCNLAGQRLGYLHHNLAVQIAADIDYGTHAWVALVRCATAPTASIPGGLIICLCRCSEKFIKDGIRNAVAHSGGALNGLSKDKLRAAFSAQMAAVSSVPASADSPAGAQ